MLSSIEENPQGFNCRDFYRPIKKHTHKDKPNQVVVEHRMG